MIASSLRKSDKTDSSSSKSHLMNVRLLWKCRGRLICMLVVTAGARGHDVLELQLPDVHGSGGPRNVKAVAALSETGTLDSNCLFACCCCRRRRCCCAASLVSKAGGGGQPHSCEQLPAKPGVGTTEVTVDSLFARLAHRVSSARPGVSLLSHP